MQVCSCLIPAAPLQFQQKKASAGAGIVRGSLRDKCVRVVVANFAKRPVDESSCPSEVIISVKSECTISNNNIFGLVDAADYKPAATDVGSDCERAAHLR